MPQDDSWDEYRPYPCAMSALWLSNACPAVDGDHAAGHVGRIAAEKEVHDGCQLSRLAQPAGRDAAEDLLPRGLVTEVRRGHPRREVTRAYGGHGDATSTEFQGEGLRHAD